tara:strand:+ start:6633 stop:7334 length:702 start_codon:yes stop_codon:yes gene_type:complete
MGTSYTFLPDGVLNATHLNERSKEIESHLNGDIKTIDIKDKEISFAVIKPPKYYGAPSPKVEFVSSDIHYRSTPHESTEAFVLWDAVSTDFEPIPGLATSIHIHPQDPERDQVSVHIMTSFYCRDMNEDRHKNDSGYSGSVNPGSGLAAVFALFFKNENSNQINEVPGTRRKLRGSGKFESRIPSQNMAICANITLTKGVNHIFVGVQMYDDKNQSWRVHVFNRNIIVDVQYL